MVDKITLEIKKFLIDKFSNENDFDNLCRELEISNVYFGDYSTRITDLIHEIERNFPEFTNLYKALIKLKQNFKTQIDKLFELRDMDINPPIVTEIDKDNNYPYIHILGSITDNLPNIENDVAAKIGEKLALNDYYLITSCRKKGIDKIISNSFRNTMITNKKWDINNINNAILQNLYNEDALFNDAIKITSNTEFESYKNCLSNASAIIIIGTRKRGLDYFNFMKDNAKYNKPFFPISLNHITNKNENSDTLYSIIISNWEEYKKFYQGIDINDFKKLQFKDDINSDDIVETIINLINIVVKKKETILDSEKRPRYISDSPLGEDFLNRNKETIAFSRLVSSRDLVPPLSIGLFGNWGSGKSFFMNKMKEEIKRLSNQAQSIIYKIDKNKFEDEILNKLQNDDKNLFENYKINEEENIYELNNNIDDKIINKIIQKLYLIDYVSKQTAYCMNISLIEFNAWHYIDTNLWASLVCHIFEELATQLKILTNDEKKEKELYDNLETVKRIKLEAEEERKIAESKLTDIQKKITENKVNIMIQSLIESTLTDKKVIKELSNLKDEIINSDINQKVKSIISDIKEYKDGFNKFIKEIKELFSLSKNRNKIILLFIFLVIISSFLIFIFNQQTIILFIISILTPLSIIILKIVPFINTFIEFIKKLELKTRAINTLNNYKNIYSKNKTTKELQAEYDKLIEIENDAKNKFFEAKLKESQIEIEISSINKGKLITNFIEKRLNSCDYQKHLGIISIIRKDFEQLSEYLYDNIQIEIDNSLYNQIISNPILKPKDIEFIKKIYKKNDDMEEQYIFIDNLKIEEEKELKKILLKYDIIKIPNEINAKVFKKGILNKIKNKEEKEYLKRIYKREKDNNILIIENIRMPPFEISSKDYNNYIKEKLSSDKYKDTSTYDIETKTFRKYNEYKDISIYDPYTKTFKTSKEENIINKYYKKKYFKRKYILKKNLKRKEYKYIYKFLKSIGYKFKSIPKNDIKNYFIDYVNIPKQFETNKFQSFLNNLEKHEKELALKSYEKKLAIYKLGYVTKEDKEKLSQILKNGKIFNCDKKIERIILFIDDLDRCPSDIVINVLQAIHLILAFPLFIVVVGVDARWISKSLLEKFNLMVKTDDNLAKSEFFMELKGSATPFDYLEKIFQIPFKLKPIQNDVKLKYIEGLLEKDIENKSIMVTESSKTNNKNETTTSSINIREKEKIQNESIINENKNPKLLKLIDNEVNFIKLISPIIGDSPRSLKRFINIYRLIKSNSEWYKSENNYKEVLILLAIIIGSPSFSVIFFNMIEKENVDEINFNDFINSFNEEKIKESTNEVDKAIEELENIKYFLNNNINEINNIEIVNLKELAYIISRFSFRHIY